MKISIGEIAGMAGVSKATVSRVINNKPDVRAETREKIADLIHQYNFKPNALSRAMYTQKSNSIGLIIPHDTSYIFSNPFFMEVIRGISMEADQSGYYLLLCYPHDQNYMDIYQQKRVEGFILLSPGLNQIDMVDQLKLANAPFVSTSIIDSNNNFPNVDIDNYASSKLVVEYLISLNHSNIGIIYKQNQASHNERLRGYIDTLNLHNLKIHENYIIQSGDTSIKAGAVAMDQLINLIDPPTAIFAVSDMLAIGALQKIQGSGLKIPEDFSLFGFDDIPMAEFTQPPLTTIRQPAFEKGKRAASMLINYLQEGIFPETQTLNVELIIRETTAALRAGHIYINDKKRREYE